MVPRHFVAWTLLALLAGGTFGACGKADDPTTPLLDTTSGGNPPPESGVESTTPVPSTLAATRVFEVAGDPGCCGLPGGPYARFGFRLADVTGGFHPLTAESGAGTCNTPPQDAGNGITLTPDGDALAWTSTMPVGAIIVGSAVGARVYVYAPRSWGDTALRAPIDPGTNAPAPISSLELCYDYALRVQPTVEATWTRTVQWTLAESVSPDRWDLFVGDAATSRVTVQLAQSGVVNTPPTVHGTVTITNPTPLPATISSITNLISTGLTTPLDCSITLPFVLPAGQSLACTFTRQLADASPRTNSVTVNTTSVVRGGSGSTTFSFGAQEVINAAVHLSTPEGQAFGPFDAATSFAFDRTLETGTLTGAAERTVPLRITLDETQQTAEAVVTLRAFAPTLAQELQTSFRRTWQWTLEREVALHEVVLGAGLTFTLDGTLRATAVPGVEDGFEVSGQVTVHNPHPTRTLHLTQLEAHLTREGTGALEPSGALDVPPGGSVACTLTVQLPDRSPRLSQVVALYQNQRFAPDGASTALAVSSLEQATGVVFDRPASELDRCVEVRDPAASIATLACANGAGSTIPAPLVLGPYAACGNFEAGGVAELIGVDTGTRAQAAYSVAADVPCSQACTRTAGYWQTHTLRGPSVYDATWELLPAGADTPLFDSGLSYLDALVGGVQDDPWMQLASHWVAARLNQLAGANPTAIAVASPEAEELLRSTGPGALPEDLQWRMQKVGSLLQAWNQGEIGPGSCEVPQ